jgi:hypothetical protein
MADDGIPEFLQRPKANDPTTRINEIHRIIEAKEAGTYVLALEAGKLLAQEKEKLGHGNWLKHCAQYYPDISRRTISTWMGLVDTEVDVAAAAEANGKHASHLSIRGALKLIEPPLPEDELDEDDEDQDEGNGLPSYA